MRINPVNILGWLVVWSIAMPCFVATEQDLAEVSNLLMRARWSHEPTAVIRQAVQLLDLILDREPGDKKAWMRLGEALEIGNAKSRQATSPGDAWRQAYQLDKTDCHAGALAAGSAEFGQKEPQTQELVRDHPQCSEALYMAALLEKEGSIARTDLLQKSITIRPSSDALVTLAQELIRSRNYPEASKQYSAALSANPLFPEDWRPDGWVAVHAHLGLAWINYSRGQMSSARREYRKFLSWFNDPGPWHDLSETEEQWNKTLASKIDKGSAKSK